MKQRISDEEVERVCRRTPEKLSDAVRKAFDGGFPIPADQWADRIAALESALAEAERERDAHALKASRHSAAVLAYGSHLDECPRRVDVLTGVCDCGFSDEIDAAADIAGAAVAATREDGR